MATLDTTAISKPRPPDLIPGYRLEKLVGKGGMGEVHKAVQLSLGRTVAVKLLATELAKDKSFVARFEKEGAALAALSHPNIVSIVDKGKCTATYYLVMEYVDGPSMREVMRSPLLDSASALRMMFEVCRAIDYAHNRGIIHRDLKPENILFDEQAGGIAKVTDFGLAGFVDDAAVSSHLNMTETHVSMGTLSYMAPEQRVDAKSADHRADIYSLGVILYELLVGEVPIGNFDPPSQRKPSLDRRLDGIVARCLKPVPQDRYQKVSELMAELEPLVPLSASTQSPRKLNALDRARQAAQSAVRKLVRAVAIAVVLAALGVLGIAALRTGKKPTRPAPGIELTTDFGARWPMTTRGRIDPPQAQRRLSLGQGPDAVSIVALGRKPSLKDGAIRFPPPEDEAAVGRAVLDADLEGIGLALGADVEATAPSAPVLSGLAELLFGPPPEARAALLLEGEPGRYVALLVSAKEGPPSLEWALGERRGTMTFPANVAARRIHLELTIAPDSGTLSAFVGEGKDRRLVGDPIDLGPEWKELFGQMPKAAVGCLNGACTFTGVQLAVQSAPPPASPVAPAPPPTPPAAAATRTVPKSAAMQRVSGKKPSTSSRCEKNPALCKRTSTKRPPKRR